ncbi:MAG TPA: hypothetical protein VF933_04340 [Streptosporangiaceae bacterium]
MEAFGDRAVHLPAHEHAYVQVGLSVPLTSEVPMPRPADAGHGAPDGLGPGDAAGLGALEARLSAARRR